jgi:hypothetical protein
MTAHSARGGSDAHEHAFYLVHEIGNMARRSELFGAVFTAENDRHLDDRSFNLLES